MEQIVLNTPAEGFIDITGQVRKIVEESKVQHGLCQIFVPHTTAGVTINENADPDVISDMLMALKQMVPDLPYRHGEGNSPAHVRSTLVGCSITVPVTDRMLCLGTWQGIYFCEFDGPRKRKVWVQVVGG
ncbi:secondary thiamine-phosphate synthase enzyme YjbQ [Heliophilum fasciatum]|uniref:Secondary thiamine-phosphate synthase enzyme n=1 Tax=Heliophilum fasciatum TaxID=35700 RepID=A0A4R2RZY4_9FIRM|nr:secondary thiamine-phosphate synthase enzyme YjbQ [Heliophilum fasciatum]MCW2277853.1 secondary thiamine-phosphate synthase enzyme [Heliophilum fasciatum]TCP64655.1 secondary thiamine-phosphate synthase enzyme [Heliophilum fasciatum]